MTSSLSSSSSSSSLSSASYKTPPLQIRDVQFQGEDFESTYPFLPQSTADDRTRAARRSNVLSFLGGAVTGGFAVLAVMGLGSAIERASHPAVTNTFDTVSDRGHLRRGMR